MRDIHTHALQDVALAFNYLGRGLGRALARRDRRRAHPGQTMAGPLSLRRRRNRHPLSSNLAKQLVDRPRPPDSLLHAAGTSFPSGHVAYAGATAVALVLLYTRPGTHRLAWWTLAALAVAGIAWSRTYLHVHWLTDTVAGAFLGVGVALITFAAATRPCRPHRSTHSAG